jgi:hypothetical protein
MAQAPAASNTHVSRTNVQARPRIGIDWCEFALSNVRELFVASCRLACVIGNVAPSAHDAHELAHGGARP